MPEPQPPEPHPPPSPEPQPPDPHPPEPQPQPPPEKSAAISSAEASRTPTTWPLKYMFSPASGWLKSMVTTSSPILTTDPTKRLPDESIMGTVLPSKSTSLSIFPLISKIFLGSSTSFVLS